MPHLKRVPYIPKPVAEYTFGHAVPKTGRQACYDPKTNTYTRAACGKGILLSQGIGKIQGGPDINPLTRDSWSTAFFGDAFGGV